MRCPARVTHVVPRWITPRTKPSQADLLPDELHLVLRDERDHGVRGNAEVVGREARPQARDPPGLDLLHGTIDRPLERHLASDRVWLHLLNLRLDEIEGEAEEGGEEA